MCMQPQALSCNLINIYVHTTHKMHMKFKSLASSTVDFVVFSFSDEMTQVFWHACLHHILYMHEVEVWIRLSFSCWYISETTNMCTSRHVFSIIRSHQQHHEQKKTKFNKQSRLFKTSKMKKKTKLYKKNLIVGTGWKLTHARQMYIDIVRNAYILGGTHIYFCSWFFVSYQENHHQRERDVRARACVRVSRQIWAPQ